MMPLNNASAAFEQRYASHLEHLELQGLQTKTVDAYACAIRTQGEQFDWQIDTLTADQLPDYCRSSLCAQMLAQCASCGEQRLVPHSGGQRSCPRCQHFESQRWIERQTQALLSGA